MVGTFETFETCSYICMFDLPLGTILRAFLEPASVVSSRVHFESCQTILSNFSAHDMALWAEGFQLTSGQPARGPC